jgi:hypothetical protein
MMSNYCKSEFGDARLEGKDCERYCRTRSDPHVVDLNQEFDPSPPLCHRPPKKLEGSGSAGKVAKNNERGIEFARVDLTQLPE